MRRLLSLTILLFITTFAFGQDYGGGIYYGAGAPTLDVSLYGTRFYCDTTNQKTYVYDTGTTWKETTLIGFSDFDVDVSNTMEFAVGAYLDSPDVTVTSNGTTVSLNMEKEGGGDIRVIFSTGVYIFDATPIQSIALTAGTDISPTNNFVYILESTKLLTVSTSGWPVAEFSAVATVLCQSAASVQTIGAYKVHVWTDHMSNGNGHLFHINKWIRWQPATWLSGVGWTLNINTTASPDDMYFTSNAGTVSQLHTHTFPAFTDTTTFDYLFVNHPTPYTKSNSIGEILVDAAGGSLSGRYYTYVIWGVVSEDTGDCHLMINLPTGSYGTESAALADTDGFNVYDISTDYTGTAFLIAEITAKHATGGGGTFASIRETDLRGKSPGAVSGGGGTATTDFQDDQFTIYDNVDPTKIMNIEASGIATGTTRTMTIPDANGTIELEGHAHALSMSTGDLSISDGNTVGLISTDVGNTISAGADGKLFSDGVVPTSSGKAPALPFPYVRVILISGQSNANGQGVNADLPAWQVASRDSFQIWNNERIGGAGFESLDIGTNNRTTHLLSGGTTHGIEAGISKHFHDYFEDDSLYIIKYAWNGTDIKGHMEDQFVYDSTYTAYIAPALTALKTSGRIPVIQGFVWWQGETATVDDSTDTLYFSGRQDTLRNTYREKICDGLSWINMGIRTDKTVVNDKYRRISLEEQNSYFVESGAFTKYDTDHFTTASLDTSALLVMKLLANTTGCETNYTLPPSYVAGVNTGINFDEPVQDGAVIPNGTVEGQMMYWKDNEALWKAIDDSKFIWNNTTGSIGIGITPVYKLDVAGNLRAGNPTVKAIFGESGGNSVILGSESAFPFLFTINSNEIMRISTDSRVGIRTTSASSTLTVKGVGATTGTVFELENSSGTEVFKVRDNGEFWNLVENRYEILTTRLSPKTPSNGLLDLGQVAARWKDLYINSIDITGDIVTTGLIDGYDVSVMGVKLAGIPSNATAPQALSSVISVGDAGGAKVENIGAATANTDAVQFVQMKPQSGTGSPSGSVTPRWIGDFYVDTTGASEVMWMSFGTGNTDWKQISN